MDGAKWRFGWPVDGSVGGELEPFLSFEFDELDTVCTARSDHTALSTGSDHGKLRDLREESRVGLESEYGLVVGEMQRYIGVGGGVSIGICRRPMCMLVE